MSLIAMGKARCEKRQAWLSATLKNVRLTPVARKLLVGRRRRCFSSNFA
ncbi:hypothetical protein L905_26400 [Agrobacterium sp. TS43]|nr:hypothetical protein L902_32225 [Agrobacterium radiobacter DSM 30147]KVK40330.1 hypothetical protein L903_14985 [Agrobacterium sp. JL28]KVK40410.1 hypothetical protein L904_15000 [Agrobacterium sp. LY4]KVK42110.1 hypothetical protein L901_09110 [Agrobacterium sp. D14]KVK54347.1 hypothetical protein L906_14950 [Agrobacterium sp. TS45]KVK56893.1 hypothetical protein L907_14915 [Agrobacterium sp. C13]KVK70977.1 hypothetical protein L905_26400 [Agrobacterium sp. TS43]